MMQCRPVAVGAVVFLLLAGGVTPGVDSDNVYHDSLGGTCAPGGKGKTGALSEKNFALNLLKNRLSPPTAGDFDSEVSLAAMLAPGHDSSRFDEHRAPTVVGFVVDVKPGGFDETCNCGLHDEIDRDTHIELALSPGAPENQRVIVEVTPRLRVVEKGQGQDWSTGHLADARDGIKGKWVQIAGWLMFDTMHVNEAENTNPGNPKNWRATCWEIHPITSIKVLDGPPAGLHQIHPDVLAEFYRARARDVSRDPARKRDIEARNKKLLEGFKEDELEQDHR